MPAVLLFAAALAASVADARPGPPFAGFDDFRARYLEAPAGARPELLERFLTWHRNRSNFPIIEADSVVFLFVGRGTERNVAVIGDFHTKSFNSVYWDEVGEPLAPLAPQSNVFWKRMKFEADARFDYQFVVDGKFTPDPTCAHFVISGAAPSRTGEGERACELMMPGYPISAASAIREGDPPGKIVSVEEEWANPKLSIYLPPGYDAGKTYPVVYTTDGKQWRQLIGLPAALDSLIADGRIEPVIVVMIDSAPDRADWYQFNPRYLVYLEKVIGYVDGHYATRRRADARLHLGSSAGARAGLQVGLARPDLISNLALVSPSLTAPPHIYEPYFSGRKRPDRRLKVWVSAGSYEGYIHADAQMFQRLLRKAGLRVRAAYTHEGHSFGTFRNVVPDMLAYFFPGRAGAR